MNNQEAIEVMFNEWKCIDRNDGINCDRKCESCDLVMDVQTIREAFNMAISALQEQELKQEVKNLKESSLTQKGLDTISRQAAIELAMQYCPDDDGSCSKVDRDIRELLDDLENLPSAQPEQSSEIQGILDYLDTVLHPIVSPEHWDVYSELHDMISRLLSAQFEPNCKGCKHQPRFSHEEPCCTCANNYENKYER